MSQSTTVKWDALRSLAFGAIGGAYAAVGTPFHAPARILIIQNLTDTLLVVSFDGVTDNLALPSGGQLIVDYMSDQASFVGYFMQSAGTQVYVKDGGVAPTAGSFNVSLIYGKGD